jgi:RNA polymerase sigma factor for flagellar operon FliA
MQTDLGRQPTLEELADHMQLNVAQLLKSYGDASRVLISLDAPLPNGESLYDTLPDDDPGVNPTAVLMESELHLSLKDALQTLPDRDRQLLSLYYVEELTMRDIGEVLGVSESRVSQMHAKAVIELRATMQRAQQRPANPGRPAAAQPAPVPQRRILQEVTA